LETNSELSHDTTNAKYKHVQDELKKLKMKDSNVDEYIAAFQLLGHHMGMNLDDPSMLQLFTCGLLKSLADSCINIDSPENFEQWANAVQCHHRNYLKMLAIHHDYASPCPQMNSNYGQFFWCCPNQTGNVQPARPHLPPCDSNSVVMACMFCSCRKSNKIDKYFKIFEHIDLPKSRWVLCQH
jgi:hypothetical protein